MIILLLGILIVLLIVIGVPLGFAIVAASFVVIWFDGSINPIIVAQRFHSGMNSFTLLAIPFFLLAGALMSRGGITHRLIDFANALVGRFTGGLAISNVMASIFFSGISGSAVADTSMLGRIFIPAMIRDGYSRSFSVATTAASSIVAPIIPPSIILIVYGVVSQQSIIRLFVAGLVPGILLSLIILAIVFVIARRRNYPVQPTASMSALFVAFRRAIPALAMPIMILLGIVGGVFTVTETSAIAVFYSLLVGIFVYRELTFAGFMAALRETVHLTAIIMIIVGAAQLFAWQLAYADVPRAAVGLITTIADNPILFLLLLNILLLFVGTFLEANAAIVMLVPILHPAGVALGIDPIHLGIVVVVNLCLGLITPPIGLCLAVACKVGGIPLEKSLKDIVPFVVFGIGFLLLLSLFPAITLWLPNLLLN